MFKKSRYTAKVPVAHLKIVELVVLDKMYYTQWTRYTHATSTCNCTILRRAPTIGLIPGNYTISALTGGVKGGNESKMHTRTLL